MSNYIVLVKQVPDISQITGNAFDPVSGTLKRGALPSVINKLDADALAFANKLTQSSAGKIICLTMGPPAARDVLIYSLSRGADTAILLTDKALGGADTPATANPLAYAIKRIVKDLFSGNNDYMVVAGMQSIDGDTAQVPPQIAEELDIPCIAYATDVEYIHNKLQIKTIVAGGNQWVSPRRLPCVITVAHYEYPLFPSFQKSRKAYTSEIITWSAQDIKPTLFGAEGSKTRVLRVFPPAKSSRKNIQIHDIKKFSTQLAAEYHKSGICNVFKEKDESYIIPSKRAGVFNHEYEITDKEVKLFKDVAQCLMKLGITEVEELHESVAENILGLLDEKPSKSTILEMFEGYKIHQPSYCGDVSVVAEHNGNKINDVTAELLGKAHTLAQSLGVKVCALACGHNCKHIADELIAAGADDVHLIEDKYLEHFRPFAYRKAVVEIIKKHPFQIMLLGATPQGRVLAPMIASHLGCGLTADCTQLDIRDNTRKGIIALLAQTRPALGGNIMATICTINSTLQMATARPGVMKRMKPDPARKGNVIAHQVPFSDADIEYDILHSDLSNVSVKLTSADVIVSGGKGLRNKDNFNKLVRDLSSSLERKLGCTVESGASRAAVEHGFTNRSHQVGQTGTAVSPMLYIALGISGAIQHLIGIENAGIIVAINSDPQAPIFKHSDYYILGTAEEIVPQLIEALNQPHPT